VVEAFGASPKSRYYPILEAEGEPITDGKSAWGTHTMAQRRRLHRRHACYVTAACLEALGLADANECYEVCLLRLFRNEYVAKLADGPQVISDYRRKSPRILRAIEGLEDPREAYLCIHERWLVRGLGFVANGRWDEAYTVFREMHRALEDALL
jgi:hypothetical protein